MAVVDQTRINLGELKFRIAKRVGPDRTRSYFSYLNRLLAQKLSKVEFDKLCVLALGQENIHLHNELVYSILKNAYNAKTPPPLPPKPVRVVGRKTANEADESHHTKAGVQPPPIWSNGDLFPMSPRKSRTAGGRDRRLKDLSSSLGPNGVVVRENGVLGHCDLKRLLQNHHGVPAEQPAKRPRMGSSLGIEMVEEAEEVVEQSSSLDLCLRRNPLHAPLGIPFCPPSVGVSRRPLTLASSRSSVGRSFSSGEICNAEDLRKRMEDKVRAQGLEGVSVDCADLLNTGLDTYLKLIIKSCFQLVVSRSDQEPIKHPHGQQLLQRKPVNGVWQGHNMHAVSTGEYLSGRLEQKNYSPVSLQDFKVAMELNPKQLGENWPLLLEKICHRSFEE